MAKPALLVAALFLGACARNQAPERHYTIHGEIVSLDPQGNIAKIKHQAIEGWMGAMTMEFPVRSGQEYKALKVGDCITATVFVQDLNFAVGDIHHDQCVDAPK
jgi:Cu/Ag efflux protein CusF